MSALVFSLTLSRALAGDPTPPDPAWVAPTAQSALNGEFGVTFVPRYPDLATGEAVRQNDLRTFASQLPSMNQQSAALALRERLAAVQHWQDSLLAQSADPSLPPRARASILQQVDELAMEAVTLRHQLSMLGQLNVSTDGSNSPTLRRAARAMQDVVAFGQDIEVAPQDEVHDVVAFGGDVLVLGRVLGDAVSFGGDVAVRDAGTVRGDVEAFGGHIARMPLLARPGSSLTSVPRTRAEGPLRTALDRTAEALGLTGAALLLSALFPQRLSVISDMTRARGLASLAVGVLVGVATVSASVLFALTLLGIPVALGLIAALGATAAVGATAAATTLGGRLRRAEGSRAATVALGALALVALAWVPWIGAPLAGLAAVTGLGATVLTKFGR